MVVDALDARSECQLIILINSTETEICQKFILIFLNNLKLFKDEVIQHGGNMKKYLLTTGVFLGLFNGAFADDIVSTNHHIAPYMSFKKVTKNAFSNKVTLMGVSYKYDQLSGYNAKANLSIVASGTFRPNMEFSFQSSYKKEFMNFFTLYPFASIHSAINGVQVFLNEKYAVTQSSSIHAGIGLTRDFNENLSFAIQSGYTHDLSNIMMIKNKKGNYMGMDIEKLKGIHSSISVIYRLSENNYLEVEPHYHKLFKSGFSEKGAKLSMNWIY